jgi:hypothetical protein
LRAASDGIWARWKACAHQVASFQARFILALIYFIVLLPFVVLLRLTSDPFRVSGWHAHEESAQPERDSARRQF